MRKEKPAQTDVQIRPEIRRMRKITKWQSIEKVLRDEIKNSGLTAYEIQFRTGVARQVTGRFLNGERGITFETACKLMICVGMAVLTWQGVLSYTGNPCVPGSEN